MAELFKSPASLAVGALAVTGVAALFALYSARVTDEDWENFKRTHHCQSVGKQAGSNQGGWRCDDDRIYYRWRGNRSSRIPRSVDEVAGMFEKLAKPTLLTVLLAFGSFFVVVALVRWVINSEWYRGTAEQGGQATPVKNEQTALAHAFCAKQVAQRLKLDAATSSPSADYTAWDIGFNRYLVKARLDRTDQPQLPRHYLCRILYQGGQRDEPGNWEVQSIGFEDGLTDISP